MQPHQFKDSLQSRIYQRLNTLVAAGAATFYKDACRLMEMEPPLESTTHLVGHLLREIESSLRDILMTLEEEPIPKKKSSGNAHKEEIQTILKILGISETSAIATNWLQLPGKDSQNGLHKYAHRNDLAPPRAITEEFEIFWNQMNTIFDTVLDRLETKSSIIRTKLNELLDKLHPKEEDIKFLQGKTPNSRLGIGYFFEHLESSVWLKPLHKAGFFKNPPGLIIDSEGRAFGLPKWAQTKYLIKVASYEPETVLEIAIQIFDTDTENILVYKDLAQAALKMPPEFAVHWAERAMDWIQKQTYLDYSLLDIFGQLIDYLASENQEEKALNLAQELLTFLTQSDSYLQRKFRLDDLHYDRIINFHMLKLRDLLPAKVLTLFCALLDRYLSFSYPYFIKEEKISRDQSYYWLPNLESEASSLDGRNGINRILARAIWAITKQIIEQDSSKVEILFRQFQGYRWQIFDRLSLQLLRQFPMHRPNFIINRLTDRNRFEWLGLSSNRIGLYDCHEHALLLKEQFSNLPDSAQNQIFDWLLADPIYVMKIEIEDRELHIKHWQCDWFSVIDRYLSPHLKRIYSQLVQEIGKPRSLESVMENIGITVRNVSHSPKTGAELFKIADENISELFSYLDQWKPSGNLLEASKEGLAMELADHVIAPKPQLFLSHIERFKELDPNFMIALIRGLKKAVVNPPNEHFTFLWEPVLSFCQWMRENLKDIKEQPSSDSYSEWNRICDAVVDLVDSGLLAQGASIIPISLRMQVWQLLEPITTDIQVTPSFAIHDHNSSTGAYGSSINTVRCRAMYAILRYAYWIRQHAKGIVEASQHFDDMPEVQQVLEWHLNPQQDPSPAIRAVYGWWFPNLLHMASDWTTQRIDQIFPEEPASQELWRAAWEGYLYNCNHQSFSVFSSLRSKYTYAIAQLQSFNHLSYEESNNIKILSSHLRLFFWYAKIDLGESDNLLENFFAKAPTYASEDFLHELSSSLLYGEIDIDDHLRLRLQTFLEWRINQLKNSTKAEDFSDLEYFSWIFASGKLDDRWAIIKLNDVLKRLGTVNFCEEFFIRLEKLAFTMPQEIIKCLNILADGNSPFESFARHYSAHHSIILRAVLESSDEIAKRLAIELINRLFARSLGDYIDLIAYVKKLQAISEK